MIHSGARSTAYRGGFKLKHYLRKLAVHVALGATDKVLRAPVTAQLVHRVLLAAHQNRESSALAAAKYRFLANLISEHEGSFAQLFQDLWVLFELDHKRGGFFVEFGAADGIYLSNTYLLEKAYGWTGILAEPVPVWHDALRQNRKAYVIPKCVARASGQLVKIRVPKSSPEYSSTLGDINQLVHKGQFRAFDSLEVETISLNDLLEEGKAPSEIDYVSIDVEGSEVEVIESFDFSRWCVRLFTIEHNTPERAAVIERILGAHGYRRCFREYSLFDGWYRLQE
jgi:FkbM family methyltransferase